MAFKSVLAMFQSFVNRAGFQPIDAGELSNFANMIFNVNAGLTAKAGGAVATATPLEYGINELATVASANDSCLLPPAIAGAYLVVINDGANTAKHFGQANPANGGLVDSLIAQGTVASVTGATGVTQATATVSEFICAKTGTWKQTTV